MPPRRTTRRKLTQLAFEALAVEGGLISADWLSKVAQLQAARQIDADYRIPKGLNLRDEIGRYWRMAQAQWSDFAAARAASAKATAPAERFVVPLLHDIFGFATLEPAAPAEVAGRFYPIGHHAVNGHVPVVIAGADEGLDTPTSRFGDGGRRRSAFGLTQEYLNAADGALWGVATDGVMLRVLRDNASLTRPAWIEADLGRIFTEERYADFAALWLLIHETRFGKPDAPATDCPLELWRKAGREEGTRARDHLRRGVEEALELLGQGFLTHLENTVLRQALQDGTLTTNGYFQQLLRLVYRLIFLLTVEERGLLHPDGASEPARRLYAEGYSLRRLRERSAKRNAHDRYGDLWEALKIALKGVARGEPRLALPALGGLFAEDQCPALDAARLENRALAGAVFRLAWLREDSGLSRVNWRDMGPEELGSVYESLLELVPQISQGGRHFAFAIGGETKGNARKLSGSYYTPDSLVQTLLDSALEPVIEATIAANSRGMIEALLRLSVIDPACGSGHFLLAAARRIASHVARLATNGTPSAADYRRALRQVISRCIFGVDRNPMALELARTAFWLEAMTPEAPLTFIDHHLVCGDALIGLMDLAVLKDGVPSDAFKAVAGDDKEVAKRLAKKNRDALKSLERTRQPDAQLGFGFLDQGVVRQLQHLDALADDTLEAVAVKRAALQQALAEAGDAKAHPLALAADLYLAAFLVAKTKEFEASVPTTADLIAVLAGQPPRAGVEMLARIEVAKPPALHWPLAFAQVFAKGGFDAVLGNPPWERIKLQEQEFFASRDPEIAQAPNKAARTALIAALEKAPTGSPERRLFDEFEAAKHVAEAASALAHDGKRYPLTGAGDVNTYALFAETAMRLLNPRGRTGIIVPTGIATDDTTSKFFAHISAGFLASMYDFQTGGGYFNAIGHARYKFVLLTLMATPAIKEIKLGFFFRNEADFADLRRHLSLTPTDIGLLNPNTRTCPVFRTEKDAELTKKIYARIPVLWDETRQDGNPWGIRYARMFDMSNDSGVFRTAARKSELRVPLPLYEAKMIHHFDHRWATYVGEGDDDARDVSEAEKAGTDFTVTPRYWVEAREVYLRTASLPKGLLQALREQNVRVVILAVAHLLFAKWLLMHGATPSRNAPNVLFSTWVAFVERYPFARVIAPTQLGLCGNNPACLKPLGPDYLPAEPVDQIKSNTRENTAWYAVDETSVSTMFDMIAHYNIKIDPALKLETEGDALAFAEWCLEQGTPKWFMGFRDITNATNERTVIASVLPRSGVGNSLPLMRFDGAFSARHYGALVGNLSALVLDFVGRQKVGGSHLNFFIANQLPVLPPDAYNDADLSFIVARVLELIYAAHDLAPCARDLGFEGIPFEFDPERRALLRAELDAYFSTLYGLSRDELRYMLDPTDVMGEDYPSETFRGLKHNELRKFGEYRTRRLVLEAWDRLEKSGELPKPVVRLK